MAWLFPWRKTVEADLLKLKLDLALLNGKMEVLLRCQCEEKKDK